MSKIYTFACVYPNGNSFEREVEEDNERAARQKVWCGLDENIKNNIESIEMIEVMEI